MKCSDFYKTLQGGIEKCRAEADWTVVNIDRPNIRSIRSEAKPACQVHARSACIMNPDLFMSPNPKNLRTA